MLCRSFAILQTGIPNHEPSSSFAAERLLEGFGQRNAVRQASWCLQQEACSESSEDNEGCEALDGLNGGLATW